MKLKLFALCLAIVAVVMMTAPPVFARVDAPLFGVTWTPDTCANPYGITFCVNLFLYVQDINNQAIDAAWAVCNTGSCFEEHYANSMADPQQRACTFTFTGGSEELDSWCVDLFSETIIATIGHDGCPGAC